MGMREDDFLKMTPRAFYNKTTGYKNRLDREYRQAVENARAISFYSISPHLKKSVKTIYDFWPLPWDIAAPDNKLSKLAKKEKSKTVWEKFDKMQTNKKQN